MPTDELIVLDNDHVLKFSHNDLTQFHGTAFPGGVAHAFKAMQRALPLLDEGRSPERREIAITTPFSGIGGRDAFELVTRAVTDGRYTVDAGLERAERGSMSRHYFEFSYRGKRVAVQVKDGFVNEEFATLEHKPDRTTEEEARLKVLKDDMAIKLLRSPCDEVYELVDS